MKKIKFILFIGVFAIFAMFNIKYVYGSELSKEYRVNNYGASNCRGIQSEKLNDFCSSHIAVRQGEYFKIDSEYEVIGFKYDQDGVTDKAIVGMYCAAGENSIKVDSLFSNRESIKDVYTGKDYVVKDGQVTIDIDNDGIFLLESNGTFLKSITVHAKNSCWAGIPNIYLYTGSGASAVKHTGDWPGTRMNDDGNGWYSYTVKGIDTGKVMFNGSWGQYPGPGAPGIDVSGEVWILNNMLIDKGDLNKKIKVHVKNNDWQGTPNIYVYTGSGASAEKYTGNWPGTMMNDDGDGWYSYTVEGIDAGKVMFNGSWGQFPGKNQPGIEVQEEVWILNNTLYLSNPVLSLSCINPRNILAA